MKFFVEITRTTIEKATVCVEATAREVLEANLSAIYGHAIDTGCDFFEADGYAPEDEEGTHRILDDEPDDDEPTTFFLEIDSEGPFVSTPQEEMGCPDPQCRDGMVLVGEGDGVDAVPCPNCQERNHK